jgi:hypothetical protein
MIAAIVILIAAWLGFLSFLIGCLAKVLNGLEQRITMLEASTEPRPAAAPPAAR